MKTEAAMAGRIAAHDWTRTALGAADGWPPALRTAVAWCIASPAPIEVWWGDDLAIVYNDAAAMRHGLAALARPARDAWRDAWPALAAAVERVRASGVPVTPPDAPVALAPIFGDGGRVAGIACMPDDRERDDLVAALVHDAREPLVPMMTALDGLRRRAPAPELDAIDRLAHALSRVVEDAADVARAARGTLVLRRERVELARVIERALEIANPHEPHAVANALAPIDCDFERLARALAALASYGATARPAIDVAIEDGGIAIRVALDPTAPPFGGAERRAHVAAFEPSGGAEPAQRDSGNRFGLAFARAVVELHGGRLEREEAAFVVELPRDARAGVTAIVRAPSRRVLVVEDHDDTARMLELALDGLGYTVALAHDGPVALAIARSFAPDVVLLDIGLPVMDGYELARRLRALHDRPPTFIAITGSGRDDERQRSLDAGFADLLVKPVAAARLEHAVARVAAPSPHDERAG
jgi:CheY-like chemotaxis protein/signal transduction histidine kinase